MHGRQGAVVDRWIRAEEALQETAASQAGSGPQRVGNRRSPSSSSYGSEAQNPSLLARIRGRWLLKMISISSGIVYRTASGRPCSAIWLTTPSGGLGRSARLGSASRTRGWARRLKTRRRLSLLSRPVDSARDGSWASLSEVSDDSPGVGAVPFSRTESCGI